MDKPTQLSLPVYGGATSRSFKTSIGGTITDPRDQPGRPLSHYERVVGVFFGEVVHAGGDATYIIRDGAEERAPTHTQKITASQVLVPLSDDTERALRDVFARILEENRRAALQIGILDEDAESKAS